jgi:glutathione peroxidase
MRIIEFVFRSIQGASMPLDRWTGQPLLLVNTASECGFTPQYTKLQALWEEYRPAGLIVLGIPCNDFGAQEPGDESTIQDFCTSRFNVTFPMTEKQEILGINAHPLFLAMREEYTSDILPTWNFFKYLFGQDGNLLHHWPSSIEPDEPGFRHEIERNLSSWRL